MRVVLPSMFLLPSLIVSTVSTLVGQGGSVSAEAQSSGHLLRASTSTLSRRLTSTTTTTSSNSNNYYLEERLAAAEPFLTNNLASKVLNGMVVVNWIDDGEQFWYMKQHPYGFRFTLVDSATGMERDAFDHEGVAEALRVATGIEDIYPDFLPIIDFTLSVDDGGDDDADAATRNGDGSSVDQHMVITYMGDFTCGIDNPCT